MIVDRIDLYSAAEPESLATAVKFAELGLSQVDPTDSYILEQAWGLDANEMLSQVYGGYGDDKYRRVFSKERELVFKIRLNPQYASGETHSSLRDDLYKLISRTRTGLVEVQLMNGGVQQAFIQGYIVKFEADIFTKQPVIQITIECTYPLFRGPNYTVLTPVPEDMPDYSFTDTVSTAPHGLQMTIDYGTYLGAGSAYGLLIMPEWGDDNKRFWSSGPIAWETGAEFHISSEEDNKYFYIDRPIAGQENLMDQIRRDLDTDVTFDLWPVVWPGRATHLGIKRWNGTAYVNEDATYTNFSDIRYRPHFWGI